MASSNLLELKNLTTIFPTKRGEVRALDGINLNLAGGEILGLVGESGCGKSTVLLSILRLIRTPGQIPAGEIHFRQESLLNLTSSEMRKMRGKEISMIFQDPLSTLNPVFQVGEQIRESLRLHHIVNGKARLWPFSRGLRKREQERVIQVMEEVGIPSPMDRYTAFPHQFSGGMQQRALIAIALACDPALLLADEPTTSLDVTIQAQIMDLMRKINREYGTAIILVTHDLGLAAEFCSRIAVMYAGRIVELGTVDQVVHNPLHPYTQGLLACRPVISFSGHKRIMPIRGNVPDLAELPAGCAFAPRCDKAQEACLVGAIPMTRLRDEQMSRCLVHHNFQRSPDWEWETVIE